MARPEEIVGLEFESRLKSLQQLASGANRPICAHLRIESAGRVRDILLGAPADPAARPPIVDWESAPLADVFFETREGDEYELELGERILEGRVLQRNLLRIESGELVEVANDDGVWIRDGSSWQQTERAATLRPRAEGERRPRKVELDATQQSIVDLPRKTAVLVLGEAGAGKTTVAVHRIQKLLKENPRWRAGVIVPTEPLRHRIDSMLRRIGVHDVQVMDFDRWALNEVRRAFDDLPTRDSRHAPAGVVRIKRDPALRMAMRHMIERWSTRKKKVGRNDLSELFGDRTLLELVAKHADPVLPLPQIDEVLAHTSVQFSVGTEEELAGIDSDSLTTIDGEGIDEGNVLADAWSLDPEDAPVLFALDRLHAQTRGRPAVEPRRFDLLFVDEAQELGPLELELLGRAHRGSLIVAGDAGQQVDPSANFRGWETTLQDFGSPGAETVELKLGYRCPPPISEFAHAIAGGTVARPSEAVRVVPHAHDGHLIAWLVDEIRALRRTDPALTIGVVVRDAARFSRLLGRAMHIDGAEELRPGGTHVVSVDAAKGLEFDTVIVADASDRSYPDTPASRRALYVAITRATHQLVLTWSGDSSPLFSAS